MPIIKPKNTIVDLINKVYEENQSGFREHLGASLIGQECMRKLWYDFRWFKKPSHKGQLLRLFETGQLYEPRFVKMLQSIGWTVNEIDLETGNQFRFEEFEGHFGGSCDGIVLSPEGTAYIAEFKTHNEKSFKDLNKRGLELSKPEHYAQMQIYMYKFEIENGLYLAVNKNTDELYYEKIKLKKREAKRLIDKAKIIIESTEPPPRMHNDPTFYKCNWCDYRELCHFNKSEDTNINCRTCKYSKPNLQDGGWDCTYNRLSYDINKEEQLVGCEKYEIILKDSLTSADK